jgi:integrase
MHWNGERPRVCSDKQGQTLDTYQRALNLLSKIQHEIDNHIFDPSKYISTDIKKFWTSTLLEKFLNDKIEFIAPSYIKDYRRYIEAAKEFFKTVDIREIRKYDIHEYRKFIETGYKPKGKTAKAKKKSKTIKNYLDVLKTFMFYVRDDLEILNSVPSFPEIEVEEYEWKWLDMEDQVYMLSHIPDKDRPIIIFLMLHGCRPGEARALKVKDVNIKNKTIKISSTFSGNVMRSKRKGKKSRPLLIPLHPEMHSYLLSKVSNSLPEAFIFINPRTGMPYTMQSLNRLWDRARRKAKIPNDLRLYDASRHSFASQLINNDASLYSVSKMLGHSSTKMTEKYAHNKIEKLRADMSKLSLQGKISKVATVNRPSTD